MRYLVLLLLLVCSVSVSGQESFKQIVSYINHAMLFGRKNPQEKVYLHFDNTGYFKGETMWFKAYVLRADSRQPSDISGVLYVDLLNPSGNVVEHRKLKVVDGEAHGDIRLDSILGAGFYEVRAYTRYMLNFGPSCCFSRVFPIFRKVGREGDYSHPIIEKRYFRNPLPQREFETDSVGSLSAENGKERARRGLHVNFYPEGGKLVVGLRSVVAFEVIDEAGTHVQADGVVNTVDGTALCSIHTDSLGRGKFEFVPTQSPCVLLLTDREKRKMHRFELPQAEAEGCVVRVDAVESDNPLVRLTSSAGMQGRLLGYAVMNGGKMLMADTLTAEPDMAIELSRTLLGPGVNQFTLFSADGQIQSERLFFLHPHDWQTADTLRLNMSEHTFRPCDSIRVEIQTLPRTSLSFSAMDASTRVNGSYGDILSYMLLGSEVKGYVAHPEYYFEADDAVHRLAADRLMLINGWRRYDWQQMAQQNNATSLIHPVEKQLLIDGRLKRANSKLVRSNPIGGVDVTAYLFNHLGQTLEGKNRTDSLGNFLFRLPDAEGEWNLQLLTALDGKPKTYSVMLNRRFRPQARFLTPEETNMLPKTAPNVLFDDSRSPMEQSEQGGGKLVSKVGKNAYAIKRVEVKKQKHYWTDYSGGWYNEHDGAYHASLFYDCTDAAEEILDKGGRMPTLYEWLEEKNPLFVDDVHEPLTLLNNIYRTIDDKGIEHFVMDTIPTDGMNLEFRLMRSGPSYTRRPTVWILNNKYLGTSGAGLVINNLKKGESARILVPNQEQAPTFLDEVKSVYIVDNYPAAADLFFFSSSLKGLNPVIIFVYTHPSYTTESSKGRRRTFFEGFNRPSTFQMEDYSVLPPMEDFRRTVYWTPDVKADEAGRATVRFFNNSSARALRISAEGIAPGGRLVVTAD